ncbi:MAG: hypothetical protein LBV76_04370 [Deltaproteobacteria bacterium]|jgi:hypothetical protein|nr:hypothetical protein [Deltaproteobacteria bacterium]
MLNAIIAVVLIGLVVVGGIVVYRGVKKDQATGACAAKKGTHFGGGEGSGCC